MRAFIAIELDLAAKKKISSLQQELKNLSCDVKWVDSDNLHLTLKFLGQVPEEQTDQICSVLEKMAKEKTPYSIALDCIGAFPNPRNPKVIWVGTRKQNQQTQNIFNQIEEDLSHLGIPREEKDFSCHITLGRSRNTLKCQRIASGVEKLDKKILENPIEFTVQKITLFESKLSKEGPAYRQLKAAHLKTA
ncbi:MAG: RNA 2',3'-cyclic phosphodiesterase [Candidatus Omnitrophica bacterium]|jgi:2'-5' RNA ligase|nr:RNA 2',3'-cyclic phosphodiesterase [Candidatus Omnitrophota bacterium]